MADTDLEIVVRARDEVSPSLKRVESSVIRFVGAISAALASIRVITLPVQQAAEFQAQLLNVAKTTNFTDQQIQSLSKSLIDLSKRLNVSALDLAKIAEIGGQLGVGQQGPEALAIFTESASRFSAVLEVSAEEAGNAIAKIANIFQIGIRDAERISSTLNQLANNSTASGRDLIDIIQRIGTAGATVNFQQAAALAATGRDLGVSLETIGTSFNKIFLDLQTKAPQVAELIGQPVTEFTALLRTDGIAALEAYLTALAKIPSESRAAIAEQITGGGRVFALVTNLIRQQEDALRRGDANSSLLRRNLANATEGFDTGTSSIREQARVLQGLNAQIQILKNVFFALGEQIGRQALPFLTDLVKRLQQLGQDKEFIRRIQEFATYLGRLISRFISFIEAIVRSENTVNALLLAFKAFSTFKLAGILFRIGEAAATSAIKFTKLAKSFVAVASGQQAISAAQATRGARGAAQTVALSPAAGAFAGALSSIFGPGRRNRREIDEAYNVIRARNVEILAAERDILAVRRNAADEIRRERDLTRQRAAAARAAGNARSAVGIERAGAANIVGIRTTQRQIQGELEATRAAARGVLQQQVGIVLNNQRIAASLRPIPRTLALIGTGFRAIGTAALRLGRTIFTALTGPIGIAILVVTSLLDAFGLLDPILSTIGDLIGISGDKEREAAQATRDRLDLVKQQRDAAASLAEEYDSGGQKLQDQLDITESAVDAARSYTEQWAAAAKQIELTAGKLADLRFSQVEQTNTLRAIGDRAVIVKKQIEALQTELDNIRKRNAQRADGASVTPDQTRAEQDVINRLRVLEAEYKNLGLATQEVTKQRAETAAETAKVTQQEINATSRLLGLYNEQGLALAEQQREAIAFSDEAVKLQAKIDDLRTRGAGKTGATDELNVELATTQAKLRDVTTQSKTAQAALAGAFTDATPAALDFFRALAPEGNLTKLDALDKKLSAIATARGIQTKKQIEDQDAINKGIEETSSQITKATVIQSLFGRNFEKTANLLKGTQFAALGIIFEGVGARTDAAQEKIKKQAELDKANFEAAKQNIEDQADIAIAAQARVGNAAQAQAEKTATFFQQIIRSASLEGLLARQSAAQKQVADSAKKSADLAKQAYKNAQDDIVKVVQDSSRRLVDFQIREADRRNTQVLDRARILRDREKEILERASGRQFDIQRDRVQQLGLGKEATQAALDAISDQEKLVNGVRDAEFARRAAVDEVNLAYQRQTEIQAKIATSSERIATLDAQRKKATDPEQIRQLTAEISVQVASVDQLTKDYETQAKTIEELGRKQFPSLGQLQTVPIVDDAQVQKQLQDLNTIQIQAARLKQEVARTESEAAARISTAEEEKSKALQEQLERASANVKLAAQSLGDKELAKSIQELGQALAGTVPGANLLQEKLKAIGETGINTEKFSTQSAELNRQISEVSAQITARTDELVKQAVTGGATTTRELFTSISQQISSTPIALDFVANTEKIATLQNALNSLTFTPTVAGAGDQLAADIESRPYKITIEADIKTTGNVPGFAKGGLLDGLFNKSVKILTPTATVGVRGATGGLLHGPGTGTSDSILAALSTGEYVMDAQTTRIFGPHFFSALQSIANRGRSAMAHVMTPRIPRFAVGGPALSPAFAGTGGDTAPLDTVRVELNVGGKMIPVAAERRQAQELARTLKNLSRGL